MSCSSRFSEVPVIDVTANNIKELWPSIALAVKSSTFVAIDTELSGLGDRKLLKARSLPDRYQNLCGVAKTRSVLSLGLSCFKLKKVDLDTVNKESTQSDNPSATEIQIKQWSYSVQTFNVALLCSEDYVVEPEALKFLVDHGFDFNKQYSAGVSYCRGKGQIKKANGPAIQSGPTGRQLFDILLWSEVPIVLHNGFVDLIFLYQSFYTDLPSSLQVFMADLAEMFPQGILDTKYLVEFVERLPATYLEYVFRKLQRKNALLACTERREVCLEFGHLPANKAYVSYSHCGLPATCVENDFIPNSAVLQELICPCFAGHGWCAVGKQCPKSHAVDMILDLDGAKAAKNRKRRNRMREIKHEKDNEDADLSERNSSTKSDGSKRMRLNDTGDYEDGSKAEERDINSSVEDASVSDEITEDSLDSVTGKSSDGDYDVLTDIYLKSSRLLDEGRGKGHRAGFDAFMTGFILACNLSKLGKVNEAAECVVGASIKLGQLSGINNLFNKIYIIGKDQPMTVCKSNFCKSSKNHQERIQQLKKK